MSPIPPSTLDRILYLQIGVVMAGEADVEPSRLGWWKGAISDPDGGGDVLSRVAPRTGAWLVYQALREAGRRVEDAILSRHPSPERIISIFHHGFLVDEKIAERLVAHRRSGKRPEEALTGLPELLALQGKAAWKGWLESLSAEPFEATPRG